MEDKSADATSNFNFFKLFIYSLHKKSLPQRAGFKIEINITVLERLVKRRY